MFRALGQSGRGGEVLNSIVSDDGEQRSKYVPMKLIQLSIYLMEPSPLDSSRSP